MDNQGAVDQSMRHLKDLHHWVHGRVDDLGKMDWDNAVQAAKSVLVVAETGKKEFERRELEAEMQAVIAVERAEAQLAIEEASAMQVDAQRVMAESQRALAQSQRAMAGIQGAIKDARRQGYDEEHGLRGRRLRGYKGSRTRMGS